MDVDFPVTTITWPDDHDLRSPQAVAQLVLELISTRAIATDAGGFYVRVACSNAPHDVDYVTEFNKQFDAVDLEWRLETTIPELEHLLFLFRMIDMNEMLRVF